MEISLFLKWGCVMGKGKQWEVMMMVDWWWIFFFGSDGWEERVGEIVEEGIGEVKKKRDL